MDGLGDRPSVMTWPSRISAFSRSRERSGSRSARARSSRSPACASPIVVSMMETDQRLQPLARKIGQQVGQSAVEP